jgi:GPI mannosyltransferase 3
VDAAVDILVAGQPPLRWIYANFHINLVEHKSASFGTKPAYWYLTRICNQWRLAALGIVPLAIVGARRYPVLLAVALVNLFVHSLIPHKEYRFILLSSTLLVVLAAFGTVDALQRRAAGDDLRLQRLWGRALLLWLLASLLVATAGPVRRYWKSGRALITAMQLAGADPHTCGLALYRPPNPLTASYALYGRQTPIYLFNTDADHAAALRYRSAYDTVLSVQQAPPLAPEYALMGCSSKAYCIYRRAGGCSGQVPAHYDVNAVLAKLGK